MDAVLIVDKPAGITSAEVVRQIKARVRPARVGHLGTLDPFATGLLPILIGEATKLAPFLQDGEKEYEGVIRLGVETDTLDRTGTETQRAEVPALTAEMLAQAAARFTGRIVQQPPIFSAIKRDGVPLYRLARRGVEVEPPPPREVEISRLTLDAQLDTKDAASIHFVATCSTGTYMRSLARDIGIALGTVAHLAELRRLRNGSFTLEQARTLAAVLEALAAKNPAGENPVGTIGMREALATMAEAEADSIQVRRLRNGDSRALDGLAPEGAKLFKVVSAGALVAVAEATSRVTARVVRVFGVD
ncbi:MAG TPA: tRNA pseudouridine(55) synthase TruB [Candidatus Binataceae bacterium]|nr:tRNA pseudouridine(55) synthase TruB [Candidatus Binataceae bacterium]